MKSPRLFIPRRPTTCTCSTGLTLWFLPLHRPGEHSFPVKVQGSGEEDQELGLSKNTVGNLAGTLNILFHEEQVPTVARDILAR